jgi:hypothetical protein
LTRHIRFKTAPDHGRLRPDSGAGTIMRVKPAFVPAILLALSIAGPGIAETVPELDTAYSAALRGDTGGTEIRGHIWVDGKKHRVEMSMAGTANTSIVREDTGEVFVWGSDDDRAMRLDYGADTSSIWSAQQIRNMNPRFQGRDTVNGEAALRFAISGENALGIPQQGHVWLTPDGILVKTETTADFGGETLRAVTELVDVERGAQDPALFELPPGMTAESL